MTINPHFIQYRGHHRGPKDTGGMTALYETPEEALAVAKRCCYADETAWVNPEFVGLMGTVLRALAPIEYTDWKPTPASKIIPAGESFVAGDLMLSDHHVTRATIGLWIVGGKVEIV